MEQIPYLENRLLGEVDVKLGRLKLVHFLMDGSSDTVKIFRKINGQFESLHFIRYLCYLRMLKIVFAR